jgi:transposase
MVQKAAVVVISERQRTLLERWERNAAVTPQRLVERCRIIMLSAEGVNNTEQGRRLGVDRQRIRRWRTRWAEMVPRLDEAERAGANDKDFARLLREVLDDSPRPGGPPKFSAEELAQIMSVACEPPEESERPVSHWTPAELADEVAKRGIVDSISPRHIDRFLKRWTLDRTKADTG